jgi:hypothetical protein
MLTDMNPVAVGDLHGGIRGTVHVLRARDRSEAVLPPPATQESVQPLRSLRVCVRQRSATRPGCAESSAHPGDAQNAEVQQHLRGWPRWPTERAGTDQLVVECRTERIKEREQCTVPRQIQDLR